eukprot:11888839-Karenia_brevis.AAC.1
MDSSGSGVQGDTPTSTCVDPEPAAMESSGSGVQGDIPQPPQSGTPPPNDQPSPSEEANYYDSNAKTDGESAESETSSVH